MAATIAVVDNNEAILDALGLVLESEGWVVRTYSSGEQFLAEVDHHRPDCLILDPHLPGISGVDIARSLEQHNARIPIIGLSARPNSQLALEVSQAGARVMLVKPASSNEVIEQVQAALAIGRDND